MRQPIRYARCFGDRVQAIYRPLFAKGARVRAVFADGFEVEGPAVEFYDTGNPSVIGDWLISGLRQMHGQCRYERV